MALTPTRSRPTASGKAHDEARWVPPPLVLPRGHREMLWHLGVGTLTIGTLLLPGGWYALLSYAAMVTLVNVTPRMLRKAAVVSATAAALLFTLLGGTRSYPEHLMALISHHILRSQVGLADILSWSLLIQPFVLLAVAAWLSFDTRAVTRGVADERVYQRQLHRRTQALRQAHRTQSTPTTVGLR